MAAFETENGREIYRVGPERENASFVSLLLDLKGNRNPKTIVLDAAEYDLFAEYMAEVEKGRIVIPPDDIRSPDYFEPYNAFVPDNTRLVSFGEAHLRFEPEKDAITLGASRTWSPLNIYGNFEMENITVIGHNCRYCLHNDDHGKIPGARQVYRNCRFVYRLSDKDAEGRLLGFNNTIGFGISRGSTHLFEDCEILFDGEGNHSAYYGHSWSRAGAPETAFILLKNCVIHAADPTNNRVIRLQTLPVGVSGKVVTKVEGCHVNGEMQFHLYRPGASQHFDVTFLKTNRVPVNYLTADGAEPQDPYTVKFYD